MRRWVLAAASVAAMVTALSVGPFGAAAAAPWVYGCTPAAYANEGNPYFVRLAIYNGSASTAHLTHKILAGDGTIRNGDGTSPLTSTLPPTHTSSVVTHPVAGAVFPSEGNSAVPFSLRIVSDVPVSATLSHVIALGDIVAVTCTPQQP